MLRANKTLINSLFASTLLWATPLVADTTNPFTPFTASYEIDWDGSISLSGSTTRKLQKSESGEWFFESKASAMFASVYESSKFTLDNANLKPLNYTYKRSVLGKKRKAEVHFDWQSQLVTNKVENKPWQMPIKEGVQDKISYQLLLQQAVAKGDKEFKYSVADGGKLKEYNFIVDGKESIKAPIGEYEAIRVKRVRKEGSARQTYIWFAPELNHQIIKLHQIEKKNKAYTLLLKELKK
ncbi:DUF3108 domain-containing protein [Neptuniibacter sp. QD29_5]|uniref:DUF3108 domain-containing protein n=1 Tax=Neptuniibacter sp. QD29_5 TaxID=3398207 RepID=UPI0039F5D800